MALTTEQKTELLNQLRNKVPPWHINAWLVKECGITFREATHLRKDAEAEIAEDFSKKAREALDAKLNRPPVVTKVDIEVTECMTCGSKDFSCDCPMKRPNDMDF